MTIQYDPTVLPSELPVPQDDGATRHLAGMKLPPLSLVGTDGSSVDLSSLRQEIRRALPLNCPHYLVRAGELPRNAMGKVQRRQLVEQVTAVLQRKVENEGVGEHRADRDQ